MKRKYSLSWLPVALLLAASCSDQTSQRDAPLAPQFSQSTYGKDKQKEPEPNNVSYLAEYTTDFNRPVPGHAHKLIGPEGGSLRVGEYEIIVPPGAVSRPRQFYIALPSDPGYSERAYAHFGPHIRFAVPLTIRLPYANTTAAGDVPAIGWWSGKYWWPLPTTVLEDGRIETKTSHFSVYGTLYLRKGVTGLGG